MKHQFPADYHIFEDAVTRRPKFCQKMVVAWGCIHHVDLDVFEIDGLRNSDVLFGSLEC